VLFGGASEFRPANAGLLCVLTSTIGGIPEDLGDPSNQGLGRIGDRGWFMNNVLSLQLARERAGPRRGGSNGYVVKGTGLLMFNFATPGLDERSTSNQRLLERLEAENAQLRRSVVELVLQIQALRDEWQQNFLINK